MITHKGEKQRRGNEHTGDTLLGDDNIGLDGDDGVAHGLDLLLLNLQYPVPVVLL
jgi:hypothetical protein